MRVPYLLRRFGLYALAAWAALTLNFLLPRLAPGSPEAALVARFRGQLAPEALEALRKAFGFTGEDLLSAYATYLSHVLRGELGTSLSHFPAPVLDVLAGGLGWTILLTGSALVLSFALGTLLGALAAWRRGRWIDGLLLPSLLFVGSFPYFFLAMVALYVFGLELGWFPLRHAYADGLAPAATAEFAKSVLRHLVLPAGVIVLASLGGWALVMRNALLGVLGEPFVTAAAARGLPPHRVLFRHAVRNAMLPSVTALGTALGFVLGGSLLTEMVFSYPGLGYLLLQAVRNQDYPLIQGLFLFITLAALAASFAVDLLYAALDPRVRR